MEYQALYRTWRPKAFAEIIGQDALVRVLRNQVENGRIAHAYLFCGPRGTGKTSTAKVFAQALRCLDSRQGEPCGVCASCVAQDSLDVVEIDAASNNGVDEIRELREKVQFTPAQGKYRVYIIDEVHMLSTGAFNALLKTLEEPPAHIVFILATTEAHKLPATIISRCQRYDFHRVSYGDILAQLQKVTSQGDIAVQPQALMRIARAAQGGLRDALSILDQCLAFSMDALTLEDVLSMLGAAQDSLVFDAAQSMLLSDASGAVNAVGKALKQGADPGVFLHDLTQHMRNLMLIAACGADAATLEVDPGAYAQLQEQSKLRTLPALLRMVNSLMRCGGEMRYSDQAGILLECAVVECAQPSEGQDISDIRARLEAVEIQMDRIQSGQVPAGALQTPPAWKNVEPPGQPAKNQGDMSARPETEKDGYVEQIEDTPPAKAPPETPVQTNGAACTPEQWQQMLKLLEKQRMALYVMLKEGRYAGSQDGVVHVAFSKDKEIYALGVGKQANLDMVCGLLKQVTGNDLRLQIESGGSGESLNDESKENKIDRVKEFFSGYDVVITETETKE